MAHIPFDVEDAKYWHCYVKPKEERWDIKKLCDWGGWSTEFEGTTIFRYLVGAHDRESEPREEYTRKPRAPCTVSSRKRIRMHK